LDRSYCTAADLARETGYHRTTVAAWIKAGKVKSVKKEKANSHYRIYLKYFKKGFIGSLRKADMKHGKWWTATEIFVLRNNMNKDMGAMVAILPHRTQNAIAIKRTRERRKP